MGVADEAAVGVIKGRGQPGALSAAQKKRACLLGSRSKRKTFGPESGKHWVQTQSHAFATAWAHGNGI